MICTAATVLVWLLTRRFKKQAMGLIVIHFILGVGMSAYAAECIDD